MATTSVVSDDEVEQFWDDGVLCLRGLFTDWVAPMRRAVDEILGTPGPLSIDLGTGAGEQQHVRDRFYIELGLWERHAWFRSLATESPAVEIADRLLRSKAVHLFFDQLFVKEPGSDQQRTPWHQDQPYWPIRGNDVISVWVTADRVTPQTGALRYVRGSHRWDDWYRPYTFGSVTQPVRGIEGSEIPDIDAEPERYEFLTWDLEPGDCLVHHGRAIHGGPGNASPDQRRRAYSIRYVGDDVRWDPRPGVLDNITVMTTKPITLQAGDVIGGESFPRVRG